MMFEGGKKQFAGLLLRQVSVYCIHLQYRVFKLEGHSLERTPPPKPQNLKPSSGKIETPDHATFGVVTVVIEDSEHEHAHFAVAYHRLDDIVSLYTIKI